MDSILRELVELRRRLEEHDRNFNAILERLDIHGSRLEEHDRKFNEVILELRRDVSEIRAHIERTSLILEEEAREVSQHRLKRIDISIELKPFIKPDLELNIYGVKEDLCVIGEVSTRRGVRIVDLLNEKVDKLRSRYPDHVRPKIVKVIYTLWATHEVVEKLSVKEYGL